MAACEPTGRRGACLTLAATLVAILGAATACCSPPAQAAAGVVASQVVRSVLASSDRVLHSSPFPHPQEHFP